MLADVQNISAQHLNAEIVIQNVIFWLKNMIKVRDMTFVAFRISLACVCVCVCV